MWPVKDKTAQKSKEVQKMCGTGACTGVHPEKWHLWGGCVSFQAFICAPAIPGWVDLSGKPGCRLSQAISLNLSCRMPTPVCLKRAHSAYLQLTLTLLLVTGFLNVDSKKAKRQHWEAPKLLCRYSSPSPFYRNTFRSLTQGMDKWTHEAEKLKYMRAELYSP